MRNLIETIKKPKVKSVLITILEILVVAGIIFGVLMFIYSKVNKEADKTSGIAKQEESTVSKKSVKYLLLIKKNAANVYVAKYTDNINNREIIDFFPCSLGKKFKPGNYNLKETYTWMKTEGAWHQYNTQASKKVYIQSVEYKDHYPNTIKRTTYKLIRNKSHKGNSIWLRANDAKWVRKNAYRTKISVFNANDKVPKTLVEVEKLVQSCGWDPTDPNKNNPYKKQKNNAITFGLKTVTIEKGHKVNYLDNIIAKDSKGNVVTNNLKYKKIKKSKVKTYKVVYKYKNLSGVQKIKVVDTTPPKVMIANQKFKFYLKSLDKKDVIKQKNIDKIKEMVRKAASVNEPDCVITVQTIDKEDLNEGDISVVVKAKDKSGNVGAAQTFVKVKVKEDKNPKKKLKFPKKKKKKHKKKVVKKKHKKKKKKKKQVETETVIEE